MTLKRLLSFSKMTTKGNWKSFLKITPRKKWSQAGNRMGTKSNTLADDDPNLWINAIVSVDSTIKLNSFSIQLHSGYCLWNFASFEFLSTRIATILSAILRTSWHLEMMTFGIHLEQPALVKNLNVILYLNIKIWEKHMF